MRAPTGDGDLQRRSESARILDSPDPRAPTGGGDLQRRSEADH